jgi:Tfp pilus assembly protein FimV
MRSTLLALACLSCVDHAMAESEKMKYALGKFMAMPKASPVKPGSWGSLPTAASNAAPKASATFALEAKVAELAEQNNEMKVELQQFQSQIQTMETQSATGMADAVNGDFPAYSVMASVLAVAGLAVAAARQLSTRMFPGRGQQGSGAECCFRE